MKDERIRRVLARIDVPGEDEARERTWRVVQAAFAEREVAPRGERRLRPLVALAAALALVAAAVSAPGRAVLDDVREAIGVDRAEPALFALPAPGRLLVNSAAGAWIVHADGSKRLLSGYREASWSSHGRFVVASRRDELAALEPDGDVRWKLSRHDVSRPRWGGTRVDTRIAYLSGRELRVVAGDGTGDSVLERRVAPVSPAWRPGSRHVVAYVAARQAVTVADADSRRVLWRRRVTEQPTSLEWSHDGRRLLVGARHQVLLLDGRGRLRWRETPSDATVAAEVTFVPGTHRVTEVRWHGTQTTVFSATGGRTLFTGVGRVTDIAWSPDRRWLLVAWSDADQWVFIRSADVRRIRAVAGISAQFESGRFPALAGWCCR